MRLHPPCFRHANLSVALHQSLYPQNRESAHERSFLPPPHRRPRPNSLSLRSTWISRTPRMPLLTVFRRYSRPSISHSAIPTAYPLFSPPPCQRPSRQSSTGSRRNANGQIQAHPTPLPIVKVNCSLFLKPTAKDARTTQEPPPVSAQYR